MKKKRIQYNGGGSLNYHKSWGDLDTSVNVQKDSYNISVNKKLPKGFSSKVRLDKYRSTSSPSLTLSKKLNDKVSIGVSKRKNQKPFYGISFNVPTYRKKK